MLCVGSLNLELHGDTDIGVQLPRVYLVRSRWGLAINLFSLHAVQAKHPIALDSEGVHLFGGKMAFPHGASGSFLRATRLPPSHPVRLAAVTAVSPLSPPVEPNDPHVDNSPPPLPAVERSGVYVDYVPPPLPAVECSEVYVDYLPPSPPARVELKGVQQDDVLPPSRPVELGNNVRRH